MSSSSSSPSASPFLKPWLPPFLLAASAGFLFGFDIGSTSSALKFLAQQSAFIPNSSLNSSQLGLIASSSLFGALLSSAFALRFGDSLGRVKELQLASILFTTGLMFQSLPILTHESFSALILARTIYGLGIGIGMHVAPVYIAESSPKELRGALLSAKEGLIVSGILFGYLSGYISQLFYNTQPDIAWHISYSTGLLIAVPLLIASIFAQESPRWMVLNALQNKSIDESTRSDLLDKAYQRFQVLEADTQLAESEFNAAVSSMQTITTPSETTALLTASSDASPSPLSVWTEPKTLKALGMGLGLVSFQQITGQPSVLYYANRLFEQAGLGSEASVGLGAFKLVATLVSASLVERAGRKSLLTIGSSAMTLSLISLALIFSLNPSSFSTDPTVQILSLLGILGFVGGYQVGFGPITWLFLGEVFPLRVRSAALGISALANFGLNLIVTALFEVQRESLGTSTVFGIFAVFSFASILFIQQYIIETKGLSLEEIEQKLDQNTK